MKYSRFILMLMLLLLSAACIKGQPATTLITGTVSEHVNVELTIYKTVNNKTEALAVYKVFSPSPDFAFAIPVEKNVNYQLLITRMKQGNRHLEMDKRFKFPLRLEAGQHLSLKITPSLLDGVKNNGVELKAGVHCPTMSIISGDLVNAKFGGGAISLEKVTDGQLIPVASYNTFKSNKKFQLVAFVKTGSFYYISSLRFRCRIYLKPADKLGLKINAFTGEYDVVNGSEENRLMEKWEKLSWPIIDYGYNRSVFQNDSLDLGKYLSTYQKLQPAIAAFKATSTTSDAQFNKLFDVSIDLDNQFAPLYLLSRLCARRNNGFVSSYNSISNPPAFYKRFIGKGKFSDVQILKIGEAMRFINLYQQLNFAFMAEREKMKLWREDKLKIMMDAIANDTVKSIFLQDQLETNEVANLSEFKAIYQPFEKYTNLPQVRKKYLQVYKSFIGDTAFIGKSSYDFSLPDTEGRMVSMKDFKGKVIFIDVWATWCGPCKAQIPFMKEIETHYKNNKNIVFVGISLDKLADRPKWAKFIEAEKLPGVQLLDDFGKTFGRKYGITAIPRFLLIDKGGKWIEIRCPKPEAKEELERYLDKALAKKDASHVGD
jgi:thiol-disulfide isomerase/thioredoxin